MRLAFSLKDIFTLVIAPEASNSPVGRRGGTRMEEEAQNLGTRLVCGDPGVCGPGADGRTVWGESREETISGDTAAGGGWLGHWVW